MTAADVNPFATRYTRLGAIDPLTEEGRPFDAVAALAQLAEAGGCGAFVGPHGSGKSTRLAACAKAAADQGQQVQTIRLRRWRETLRVARAIALLPAGSLVCVDSLEVAGRFGAGCLRRLARLRRVQLLATSHVPAGLPVLVCCRTSPALLERIVEQLPAHGGSIAQGEIEEAFTAAGGNLREALFALYDRAEARRSGRRS
ncbi:MAG: hypothetical protein ISQ70_13895 [Pirellulales bacterium]|nr:hypothetical protein [Pirellulales bacterium]MBL7194296.1 hypothetical protein [Pirellulales bacterium]